MSATTTNTTLSCRRCGEPLRVSTILWLTGRQQGECSWSVTCENTNCEGRVGGEDAKAYYYDQRDRMVRQHWENGQDCDCETCSALAASGELRAVLAEAKP